MNDSQAPRTPPRFVPVLTEVVDPHAPPVRPPEPLFDSSARAGQVSAEQLAAPLDTLEDQLIHRVMQRVDVSLERHLHEAVASMVLQHTHALVPRLREEIEFFVRQAVSEAVAAELAQRQKV